MIYTPENFPGSITIDVEKGEYIYDVLAVDMDNATVEVIDRPLRRIGEGGIATRILRFASIKSPVHGQGMVKLFICERAVLRELAWEHPCFNKLPASEIQPDTKE